MTSTGGDRSAWVQTRKPQNTAFKQQQLKAWQPILTPKWVISTFFIVGLIFIPIGVVCLIASNRVVEIVAPYEYLGDPPYPGGTRKISLEINVTTHMQAPVYFYYQLGNYYQNHRRYVKSRNDQQLRGVSDLSPGALSDCNPLLNSLQGPCSADNPVSCLDPCGLIAWSLFNDTFTLAREDADNGQVVVNWTKNGIAWPSDVNKKFKNRQECIDCWNNPEGQNCNILLVPWENGGCYNVSNEDFIVWMRTAALPTFRKLYRIIYDDLVPGTYTISANVSYPVSSFGGKKSVVLSTTEWIGGKNDFLGLAYIIVGTLCIVLGALFLAKHLHSPRKLGDSRYLVWSRDAAPGASSPSPGPP